MTARHGAQASLPPLCHAAHPETGGVILIRRGEPGYQPVETSMTADVLNALLDPVPTPLQVEAMLIGSMFGWNVPGARTEEHRLDEIAAMRPQSRQGAGLTPSRKRGPAPPATACRSWNGLREDPTGERP